MDRCRATLSGERDYPSVQGFRVPATQYCQHPEVVEANARLIAAAPDLLAACDLAARTLGDIERQMGWTGNNVASEMRRDLNAAIAKARGEATP